MAGNQLVEFVKIKPNGQRVWGGNEVSFGGNTLDAFERLRVSQPTSLFGSQFQYDLQPVSWESGITDTSGNAAVTHLPLESSVELSCEAEDIIIRQTRQYFHYQPGKSQLLIATFAFDTGVFGVVRRVGVFDANNGIYFQQDGEDIHVVLRSGVSGSPVDTEVAQADWNMDTYPELDITKVQQLVIDMEWLGVGPVRVGFRVNGKVRYVHEFNNANVLDTVYMTTANLPIRYELQVAALVVGAHTMKQICSQIASEGGVELAPEKPLSISNGVTTRSVTTALPVLSIRPRDTFNSIVNRTFVIPEEVNVLSLTNPVFYQIVFGGTLTNASWANVDTTYSALERDIAATAIAGGIVVDSGYAPIGTLNVSRQSISSLLSRLPISLNIAGAHPTTPLTDILSLVVTSMSTATAVSGGFTWRELR